MLFDQGSCDADLSEFFQKEFSELAKAPEIPDLDLGQYFQWSDDGSRVIVSFALSCKMPCAFCYVDSVRENGGAELTDRALFGGILAASLAFDERFHRENTVVFLGGMSDPLLEPNIEATLSFLHAFRARGRTNRIHIATKAKVEREDLIALLSDDKRIVLGISVPVLSGGIEASEAEILKRIMLAGELRRRGANVTGYIRPVIPGRTIADADSIAEQMRLAGIEAVAVGGLYTDAAISKKLEDKGVVLPADSIPSHLIMDRRSRLKKIAGTEVDQVQQKFRNRGFVVYDSALEVAHAETG